MTIFDLMNAVEVSELALEAAIARYQAQRLEVDLLARRVEFARTELRLTRSGRLPLEAPAPIEIEFFELEKAA